MTDSDIEVGTYDVSQFEIDQLQLDKEFRRLPALLAIANEEYAEALGYHLRTKYRVKRIYAKRYLELRIEMAEEGTKVTEKNLEHRTETDDQYQKAVARSIAADVERSRAWGKCEALRAKRDALVSLGANVRAEMQGDPSIRDRERRRRDDDDK